VFPTTAFALKAMYRLYAFSAQIAGLFSIFHFELLVDCFFLDSDN